MWCIELGHKTSIHDQDAVTVHDGVKTMSHGQHSAMGETLPNGLLDQGVSARKSKNWSMESRLNPAAF
jgi:hypothetical protein